jgi:hypothetical protein
MLVGNMVMFGVIYKSPQNQGNGRGTGAQGQANSRPW